MYWLAIEHEPVSADALHDTLLSPVSMREVLEALGDLRRCSTSKHRRAGLTLQNVVMEYAIERLIEQMSEEIISGSIHRLNTHALMKVQAKAYVRNSQVRLILDEVVEKLEQQLGTCEAVVARLTEVLALLRAEAQQEAQAQ